MRRKEVHTPEKRMSRFLFGGCCTCLGSLLFVAPDHNHGKERTDYGGAEQRQDDWDSNGPHSRGKELVKWVSIVHERLKIR